MNKIKFRAFDSKLKKFAFIVLENNKFNFICPSIENEERFDSSNLENWQQFINLFDDDKNEIYEGDIIQTQILYKGKPNGIKTKIVKRMNIDGLNGWNMTSKSKNIKVIGNIYQNSEMINN